MKALWGLSHHQTDSPVEIRILQAESPSRIPRFVKKNVRRGSHFEEYCGNGGLSVAAQSNYLTIEIPQLAELAGNCAKSDQNGRKSTLLTTDVTNERETTQSRERVLLNIRGHLYETFADTLARFPNTLLGCSEKRGKFYKNATRQYSFGSRDLSSFDAILFYYQSNGILSRPADVTSQTFYNEIRFFQLDEHAIKLYLQSEGMKVPDTTEQAEVRPARRGADIWKTLEYPQHSLLAQLFAILSLAIICLSIVIFCGETLPSIRENAAKKSAFISMEIFCITWFTLEYILRILVSPNRRKFCFSAISCIDLLTIFPFYVMLVAAEANGDSNHEKACCIFRVLKLLRVLRVLKFSRYVQGINILAQTLLKSSKEIGLLVLCIAIASLLFATLAYSTDISDEDTEIHSIPDGIWFAIISLTCIGYGDIVPVTNLGKLNASVCMVTGLVVLSLPTPVIVHNFIKIFYNRQKKGEFSSSQGYH